MPADMRAVLVPRHGGIDVLEVTARPVPTPAAGQVLVEVIASGVNFIDVYRREGVYPVPTPFVLGGECAGRVVAVGPDVAGIVEGDVVASAQVAGSHAQSALLDAAKTVPVPIGVDAEQAAAVLLQGMTAHYLVRSTFPVGDGTRVLVHAAAGGVGQLLVRMAVALGAQVIATVGREAKAPIARGCGAQHVIVTGSSLVDDVRAIAPDGVDVVYDGVGRATFEASLACLRPRGLLALFGAASGEVPPFDLQRLNPLGSLFVTRPTMADYIATPEELRWRASEVLSGVADGTLPVEIGGRYAIDEVAQAYRDLQGRTSTGKLLIVP